LDHHAIDLLGAGNSFRSASSISLSGVKICRLRRQLSLNFVLGMGHNAVRSMDGFIRASLGPFKSARPEKTIPQKTHKR
jgi:hypothetical protein